MTSPSTLDRYWIPLGAGAHVVRVSGRTYEALAAFVQRRPRRALYHSALVATTADGRYTMEMTPVAGPAGREARGVVAEGAVGTGGRGGSGCSATRSAAGETG